MKSDRAGRPSYVVPRYRADGEPAFYHVLHGTVPGHQIDFVYQPAVPQGALTQTHFAHVARLMKYIEPRETAPFAFAIGNLSRDDVQHEPGHGGLALIFCLRAHGVVDHARRERPPYAHGLIAIDRALDHRTLVEATTTFCRHFMHEGPGGRADGFYHAYVQRMRDEPRAVAQLLADHIAGFSDLPQPGRSGFGGDFVAFKAAPADRITIVHPASAPFSTVASVASALAAVLYRSNVRWTSISTGGEFDIPGGVSIRFVPEGEAPRDPRGLLLTLDEVPSDEVDIAEKLFSARPRVAVRRGGWREQYAKQAGSAAVVDEPGAVEGVGAQSRRAEVTVAAEANVRGRPRAAYARGAVAWGMVAAAIGTVVVLVVGPGRVPPVELPGARPPPGPAAAGPASLEPAMMEPVKTIPPAMVPPAMVPPAMAPPAMAPPSTMPSAMAPPVGEGRTSAVQAPPVLPPRPAALPTLPPAARKTPPLRRSAPRRRPAAVPELLPSATAAPDGIGPTEPVREPKAAEQKPPSVLNSDDYAGGH